MFFYFKYCTYFVYNLIDLVVLLESLQLNHLLAKLTLVFKLTRIISCLTLASHVTYLFG